MVQIAMQSLSRGSRELFCNKSAFFSTAMNLSLFALVHIPHAIIHNWLPPISIPPGGKSYHINLCTFPGSWGHSNPLYRNIYPVTALMSKNHTVSPHRRTSTPSRTHASTAPVIFASTPPRLFPLLARFCGGADATRGTCSRHTTHGMMKYRGSTSGAVIRERAVARRKMSRKEVRGPSDSRGLVARGLDCGFTVGLERVR